MQIKKKIIKVGASYGIILPRKYFKTGELKADGTIYNITIEQEGVVNEKEGNMPSN